MLRVEILAQLEALGFRVMEDGKFAWEDDTVYGSVMESEVMMDRPYGHTTTVIEFTDIDQIGMMEDGTFNITTVNGTFYQFRPGSMKVAVQAPKEFVKLDNTLLSLTTIFPQIFPDYQDKLWFDELMECPMCDMSMFGRPPTIARLTDETVVEYYFCLEQRLRQMGVSVKFPNHVRDEALLLFSSRHKRNPFREWMESHEWDGTPRLRTWFIDAFGARAPPLEQMGRDRDYLESVTEAWFVGAVARQYEETKHEIVPVLISPQGIGKGNALKFMAGNDRWYKDTNTDISKPERFLDSIRGRVVVELSEATQIRNKNVEALKSFISETADQMRKAYAHFENTYPRRFVMIASSNLSNVFTDITGNRRFFPMYCDARRATREYSVDRSYGQYDVEQLWAEALHLYRKGHRCWLPPNIAELSRVMQDYSSVDNPNIQLINDWLDDPYNGFTDVGARVSRQLIMEQVFGYGKTAFIPREVESAFRAWTEGNQQWEKLPMTIRIDGVACKGWERKFAPGQRAEIPRLPYRDTSTEETSTGDEKASSVQRLSDYILRNHSRELDVLDESQFHDGDIESLMDLGYIYPKTSKGRNEYVLAVMPGENE